MGSAFDRLVVKAERGKTAVELAAAAPDAISGVSSADATKLAAAFGIRTIRDMADHPYIRAAAAIAAAADGTPTFDPGPPPAWETRFAAAPLATYEARPDLFRIDFGPVFYRGRLDDTARLLVVGQDPSVNEILAQRAFVGRSGQRLQGFLTKLGVTRSYLMLNTFSYSIFDQFGGDNQTLSRQDPILGYRNGQFDAVAADNPLQAVVTVGTAARDAVDRWPGVGVIPRVHLIHPAFPNTSQLLANWNAGLAALRPMVEPDDGAVAGPDYGSGFLAGEVVSIPRRDLPFGIPGWHGDGDHATRNGNTVIEWRRDPVA
jgi:hypothetical protein